jgi:hypothetical protein
MDDTLNESICSRCSRVVSTLYDNKCEDCYDQEYSGCYGGGCIGGESS